MSTLAIDVLVDTEGWGEEDPLRSLAGRALGALGAELPGASGQAALALVDDATIRALNGRYRAKDKPTNVLSFPATGPARAAGFLGDIAIARETLLAEAARDGLSFEDHLAHLIIHGYLHLLGHDHESDDDARHMEAIEIRALARLGIADPYAGAVEAARHGQ